MAFYFSSVTKALYDTDVFPLASLPANKVEITQAVYTDLMTKQNQGYVILADGSGNPYTVNQSEASATDIKHAASVATTLALGHVKIGNTMTAANDGTIDVKDSAVGTSKLADDAITAAKVKDNETLPVNISGSSKYLSVSTIDKNNQTAKIWKKIATSKLFTGYEMSEMTFIMSGRGYNYEANFYGIVSAAVHTGNSGTLNGARIDKYIFRNVNGVELLQIGNTNQYEIWVNAPYQDTSVDVIPLHTYNWTVNYVYNVNGQLTAEEYTTYKQTNPKVGTENNYNVVKSIGQVGSPSTPVYVKSDGQVQPCDRPTIIDKIVNEDGTDIVISKTITINDSSTFYTLGKLNITPSNKERIVDFTFMLESYTSLDSQNLRTNNKLIFCVFVGNTEVNRFLLTPSVDQDLCQSFRCSFTANINNTIYIKVKRATTLEPRSADFNYPKVQGLIM